MFVVKLFYFNVYGCFAYVYICATCVSDTLGGQKRVLALLELELYVVVSCFHGCWELDPDPLEQ